MLDDLKYIHDRDAQDALGVAGKQSQQLGHDFGVQFTPSAAISAVVLAGMGGSALPGVFMRSWPGVTVPFDIVRDYDIPAHVGPNTLFISSSYSGNTEETLSALHQAEAAGAQIIVIAAGGKLAEYAAEKGYPLLAIPSGIQPRMSSFYFIAAFVQILEPIGLITEGSRGELLDAASWLEGQNDQWVATVKTASNPAKQLALELIGKSVVVYSGPKMFPAANKFKICLNENAKNVAWVNQLPEFNHNEFIGWSSHPIEKPYAIIDIRSNLEHERVQKRFEVSERLLSGKRPAPEVVVPHGETVLQQLLWTSVFADHVSIYVALANGVNPTPVDLVESFKKALDD